MYTDSSHHRRSIRLKGYDYSSPGAYFVTIVTWQRDILFGEILEGKVRLSRLGEIVREEWLRSVQIRREIELYGEEFVIMPNHLHGIVWIIDNGPAVEADGVRPMDGIRPTGAVAQDTHQPGAHRADEQGAHRADEQGAHRACEQGAHRACEQGAHRADEPGAHHADEQGAHRADEQGAHRADEQGAHRADEPGAHRACEQGAHRAPLPRRAGGSLGSFVAGFKSSVTSRARRELDVSGIWQRNYYEHIIRNQAEMERIQAYIHDNPIQWEADQLNPAAEPNRFNQE